MDSYRSLRIRPLTPRLGAEVFDVDLAQLSDEALTEIRRAFAQYLVLVFRHQMLSRDDHKAFARHFGKLHVHPSKSLGAGGDPEIFHIRTTPESAHTNGEAWHSDVSCEPVPPLGSMLYVRELPGDAGGDTLFANMYEAYSALSQPIARMLEGLIAHHDGRKDLKAYNVTLKPGQSYPQADHPVVIRHPDTNRPALFVNRSFTECIHGLTASESDALLELLWRHAESNPRFQCRVRWEPGTLTFWDNRATLHHAVWDYYPATRIAERVSIVGQAAPTAYAAPALEKP